MARAFRKSRSFSIDLTADASMIAVDLLKVLKSKYDYKALSAITGIPVSTLTRYITGKTAPRSSKAERLLKNLLENINLAALISESAGHNGDVDLAAVMLNPNMLKIIGAHVLEEFSGMKITAILPLDVLSVPLASYLSTAISRTMYLLSSEPVTADGHSIPVIFREAGRGAAKAYWLLVRRSCKNDSVLAISAQTPDPYLFNALVEVLAENGVALGGFFSVTAEEEKLRKLRIPPGVKRSYIVLA
ncbi:MAG: hypothetical protein DRN64_00050 [Thaumarchaeota archaeon]|nr:MAG: hypothetical protein DRN64_00050 [Nitrososphaerota archaeon]